MQVAMPASLLIEKVVKMHKKQILNCAFVPKIHKSIDSFEFLLYNYCVKIRFRGGNHEKENSNCTSCALCFSIGVRILWRM